MARNNGDQTKATFGPEWLKESSLVSEDDLSIRHPNALKSRTYFTATKKVPLRFTRSKSTPLLPLEEQGNPNGRRHEDVGGFAMLKEQNSFERHFPTLDTKVRNGIHPGNVVNGISSSPPPPTTSANPSSAWKISSQSKTTSAATSPPNSNSTSPGTLGDTEMHLASLIVPNVQPPKLLTQKRVELLTKKGPNKKKFGESLLRKATSEPNLPIPPAYQENYSKLMNTSRKGAPLPDSKYSVLAKATDKPKTGTVVLHRSDFFKGIMKKEQITPDESRPQHRRMNSDDSSGTESPLLSSDENMAEERLPSGSSGNVESKSKDLNIQNKEPLEQNTPSPPHSNSQNDAKIWSVEDEERVLRDLGWLPEDEAHVPELSEQEIHDWEAKKLRWMNQMNQKKHLSLDVVTIQRWQTERGFATKIY